MSARVASPAAQRSVPLDPVRALQHTLYRCAKADPQRRFHALWDKIVRNDVLRRAWIMVYRNDGAPGVDRITLEEVKQRGVAQLLTELASELKNGTYSPLPARRVFIPKPGSGEQRPLSIPAIRDRIVQAAVKIVLEPIFEADMLDCSFGFRPKRRAHDALQVVLDEAFRGRRWVMETDIANCFEAIPHPGLMQAIKERICDQSVLKLLRVMLRAGVMQNGAARRAITGTPQGGVLSPLLANIYLHRIDRAWMVREHGVLVRYADDAIAMCRSREQADAALTRLTDLLGGLGLEPKAAKTRTVHLVDGGEGFDFLGFHHRMVRSKGHVGKQSVLFLARWPSRKAVQHAHDRLRALSVRSRLRIPSERIVQEMNLFLRGWCGYFRHGNSARVFNLVHQYALLRLVLFTAKRHQRDRHWALNQVAYRSHRNLGLINLTGTVIAPRPRQLVTARAEYQR